MGHMTDISQQIANVLSAVQQAGSSAFADVKQYPSLEFAGMPAVIITPSDNESDYATIVQNLRTYVFNIDIYYPIEQVNNGGYATAFSVMMVLVDTVLDALDNSNDLNNTCDMLRPVPSSWSEVQGSTGPLLNARVTVRAAVTVNTNNG